MARMELGLGLLWLGLGFRLWIRLGMGMVGPRLGRLEPVLGMATVLLQPVAGWILAFGR
jgi:hypothetical protein